MLHFCTADHAIYFQVCFCESYVSEGSIAKYIDPILLFLHAVPGTVLAQQKGTYYMKQFVVHRPRWQMALAFFVLAFALALVPVLTVFTGAHAAGANRSTKPTFSHFKGLTYALAQS